MRSLLATFLLLLAAAAFCALAAWQWSQGNFDSVFGAPPTPVGERLYGKFQASDVKHIRINSNGITATFELRGNGWHATSPWADRMDPRAAADIINFTLAMRVEDYAPDEKIKPETSGLGDSATNVRLEDASRTPLAYYKIGRNTPWKELAENMEQPNPTVYIQPRDKNRKRHVYACTGDLNPWFKDGLKNLRDHHPLFFNPLVLGKIRIRSQEGELTLERKTESSIPAANLLQEISTRFVIADRDRNARITEEEWFSMITDPNNLGIERQKFTAADGNRDKQLSSEEFIGMFAGPWRIVKPLELSTSPNAIKTLLEGLVGLKALRLGESSAETLPGKDSTLKSNQIAISTFGSEAETLLEIRPPDSPDAPVVKATVSDRPGVLFELPSKPETGRITLANLPLSINDLRDPILSHLDIAVIRGISIKPSTGEEIVVSREGSGPWLAEVSGRKSEANEENLFELLKAVTTSRVIRFPSDAATDFTPWGLNRPALTLRFLAMDNQTLEIRFGMDGKGAWFANRLGTPTVMEVSPDLIQRIAVRPYEWRLSRVWSVDKENLLAIRHQRGEEPATVLNYKDDETWTAVREGKDIIGNLDPARARYMLDQIEGLKASQWLAPDDADALAALKKPLLTLTVTEFAMDGEGERSGVKDRTIRFAQATGGNAAYVYGSLDGDPNPFLLDLDLYQKIAIDLFEKQP